MFTIKSAAVEGDAVATLVEFILDDGSVKEIRVPCFRPQSADEVVAAIEGREASEQALRAALSCNEAIVAELAPVIGVKSDVLAQVLEQCGIRVPTKGIAAEPAIDDLPLEPSGDGVKPLDEIQPLDAKIDR